MISTAMTHAGAVVRQFGRDAWRRAMRVMHPERHNIGGSLLGMSGVVAPLWAQPVVGQVGVDATEQVLCADGVNITNVITVGLGLYSVYLILKFLLRAMWGADKRGEVPGNRDPKVNESKKQIFGFLQVQDSLYPLVAIFLPVLVPVFLNLAGIDVVSCLLP
jgi:hypothetical protein